jgi:predicted DNA binding CopG/RHH family protein
MIYNTAITTTDDTMKDKIHQINMKISEKDLNAIDKKAARYGLSRSSMLKLFGLKAELNVTMLRQPVGSKD